MNKKLVAVAVAGLFAAPISALAQSSVTISGVFKMSLEDQKMRNFGGGLPRAGSSSAYGVADDSSRIIFNVVEDLGGGMQAIGQLDIRFKPDDVQGAAAAVGGSIPGGNSHVGLRSSSWGRIFMGRQDLHYFNTESNMTAKANSLRSDPISLIAFAGAYGAAGAPVGGVAIAGATRTQNVIHYTTPNWSGFTAIVAYSSNPIGTDADLAASQGAGTGVRKGYAWNVNPNYAASNWQVGYSFWKSKPDGGGAGVAGPLGTNDQRADRIYGSYTFGFGLKLGLAWDKSRLNSNSALAANVKTSDRQVWSIPVGYTFGNHNINAHFTWAQTDKAAAQFFAPGTPLNTKAKMFAIGYAYDISKRTSVGVTYAQINNQANAAYNFFTQASLGVNGAGATTNAGEDPRMFAATIRHAF